MVVAEIVVVEFLESFLDGQRQVDNGLAHEFRRPVAGTDFPRPLDGGEFGGGGLIEHHGRVRVLLEEAGGNPFGRGLLERLVDDGGLVLAEGHEESAAGVEDAGHAHRQRLVGNVLLAEETAGGVPARDTVERHHARARVAGAAGFVEADVARAADAEDLHVDAARCLDLALVLTAERVRFIGFQGSVGDVDVVPFDVDLAEERLVHPAEVRVGVLAGQGVVFVEVERDDAREVEILLLVEANQFAVKADGGAARGESQHGGLARGVAGADELVDLARDVLGRRGRGGEEDGRRARMGENVEVGHGGRGTRRMDSGRGVLAAVCGREQEFVTCD